MADPPVITFHWADYLVLGLFLLFSALLGVIIGFIDRKKASSKDFMMGGGNMHWIPVALSMQASFLSAIFILSTPVEIYNFGTTYAYLGLSYFTALPIAAHMFIPTFYRLKLLSAYEYLEIRFNRAVRIAGSLTFCVMALLYMSVVLYTPAIALAQVTGLPVAFSIVLCGVVCTIYTVLGGMKATIWNDFIQMIIIVVGLLVIICLGAEEQGGMNKVWAENEDGGRIIFDEFNPDPTIRTTFWTQTVGGTFVSLTMYASSQTIIQKSLSVKSLRNAQKAIWLAAVTSLLFLILVTVVGLIMYAHFADCDPLLNNKIDATDQMVPLLVMEVMGHLHGLPGLFIATAFSAALSSVSGSVNALSAVTLVDFIKPIYFRIKKVEVSERSSAILSRVLALIYGLITTAMGFVAQYLGDLVLQIALSIFGFVGGPLTAVLALGLFFPFVNSWGALFGLIISLGITSWIAVGAIIANVPTPLLPMSIEGCLNDNPLANATNLTEYYTYSQYDYTQAITDSPATEDYLWVYKVSHMYYGLIAMAIAFIVGIVVSLITGVAKDTDPKLLFMWNNECCCYCPTKVRNCFRCCAGEERESDDESEIIDKDLENKNALILGIENQGFNYVQCRELDFKPGANDVTYANAHGIVNGSLRVTKGHIDHSTNISNHADGGTNDSAKIEHSESRPTSNVYEDFETKSSHSSNSSVGEGSIEDTVF